MLKNPLATGEVRHAGAAVMASFNHLSKHIVGLLSLISTPPGLRIAPVPAGIDYFRRPSRNHNSKKESPILRGQRRSALDNKSECAACARYATWDGTSPLYRFDSEHTLTMVRMARLRQMATGRSEIWPHSLVNLESWGCSLRERQWALVHFRWRRRTVVVIYDAGLSPATLSLTNSSAQAVFQHRNKGAHRLTTPANFTPGSCALLEIMGGSDESRPVAIAGRDN